MADHYVVIIIPTSLYTHVNATEDNVLRHEFRLSYHLRIHQIILLSASVRPIMSRILLQCQIIRTFFDFEIENKIVIQEDKRFHRFRRIRRPSAINCSQNTNDDNGWHQTSTRNSAKYMASLIFPILNFRHVFGI